MRWVNVNVRQVWPKFIQNYQNCGRVFYVVVWNDLGMEEYEEREGEYSFTFTYYVLHTYRKYDQTLV